MISYKFVVEYFSIVAYNSNYRTVDMLKLWATNFTWSKYGKFELKLCLSREIVQDC